MHDLVWLIPALPLVGFAVLVTFGRRLGEPLAGWLATAMVGGSFVVAVISFLWLRNQPGTAATDTLFSWIPAGDFSVDIGYLLDPLSMTMVLFITGISTLIHLYSVGYMHGDPNFHKFFLYLNLFVFSMLVLVLGDNLLLTFLGWEGVGTCSYLLISFWFTKDENASAGKKAFVTNRVGDWGFMVGLFMTFFAFGTITYAEFLPVASGLAATTATFIAGMLFIGAIGKSAQIPLYIWLPDAMAGPTPVSALIHAATMVTAGVYLLCRINPVLAASFDWLPMAIAWVGVVTALVAATIAMAQMDIKKALAFSTISQLGYMFLAVGIGAYWVAIFHMITHAFFKACLFLGSGSVIHGMHDEQDMRRMGGLRKFMPITCFTFVIAWLAIAGVPPFSGFFSKDEILAYAFQENIALYGVGLFTALLTAYYMSRVTFRTFYGEPRWPAYAEAEAQAADPALATSGLPLDASVQALPEPPHAEHLAADYEPHESPWTMTVPLVVLAFFAATAGLLNLPFPKSWHFLEHWLEPVFVGSATELTLSTGTIVALLGVSTVVALLGVGIAAAAWLRNRVDARKIEPRLFGWGWYYDWAITRLAGGPGFQLFDGTALFDRLAIDGAVNGTGRLSRWSAARLRYVQTGYVRTYALMVAVGSVLLVAFVLTRVLSWQ
jgi:NADH-quinone oxidoreductase subunit L